MNEMCVGGVHWSCLSGGEGGWDAVNGCMHAWMN